MANQFISQQGAFTQDAPSAMQYDIYRQQQLANALEQASMQPIESAAPNAPISWTQGLAKMLQARMGNLAHLDVKKKLALSDQLAQAGVIDKLNALAPNNTQVEGLDAQNPGFSLQSQHMQANPVPGGQMQPQLSPTAKSLATALSGNPEQANKTLSDAIVQRMLQPTSFTGELGAGAKHFTHGVMDAENPKEVDPLTELGKLEADYKSGRISKDEYTKKVTLETTRAPNSTLVALTNPDVKEGMARRAHLIATYDSPPPSGFGGNNPAIYPLWKMVTDENKNYDSKEYDSRQAAVKRWAGINADRLETVNTTTQHIAVLRDAINGLDSNDPQAINAIGNFFGIQMGHDPVTNLRIVKTIVGNEIAKMTQAGVITKDDKARLDIAMPEKGSPSQMNGVLDEVSKLAGGRLYSMRSNYKSTTGYDDAHFDARLTPASKEFELKYGQAAPISDNSSNKPVDLAAAALAELARRQKANAR